MKINSIYINAFGKLKKFSLELHDGLNVIYGENENGKSTVMAFIKMMFYGSSGTKTQKISANPRLKYLPWSGETMGGRIFFSHSGHNYCLEREFKKSDSSDRIKLTDVDSGEDIPTDGCPGLKFFGIGADAFERSVFVDALGAPTANEKAQGELNGKLSNIALTGDEDTSLTQVVARLDDARYSVISKSGRKGSFVEGADELSRLKNHLSATEEAIKKKTELSGKAVALREELKSADGEHKKLQALLEKEKDIKSAEKMREYLQKKAQLDKVNSSLSLSDGTLVDSGFVKKLDFCLTRLDDEQKKSDELNQTLDSLKKAAELADENNADSTKSKLAVEQTKLEQLKSTKLELENEERRTEEQSKTAYSEFEDARKKRKAFSPMLLIPGIILAIAGVALFFVSKPLFAVSGIGIIIAVLSFIIRPADKSAAEKAEKIFEEIKLHRTDIVSKIASVQGDISETASNISLLTAALSSDAAANAKLSAEIDAATQSLKESGEKYAAALADLTKLCERLGKECDISAVRNTIIPELERAASEQKEIKLRLNYLCTDLGGISYEKAEERLKEISESSELDTDFDDVRRRFEEISTEITRITTELTEVLTEIKTGYSGIADPNTIKSQMDKLALKLQDQKFFYDAATLAIEELGESFAEVRKSYGSALENDTLEIFSRLTGGKYGSVGISKSMEITVEEKDIFGMRELDYLSQGTTDQAYLSLRLSLARLISEEALPVFLDDVLSQYDDRRTEEALSFLKEYSSERQTVLFTCHNAICNTAEQLGADIAEI